MDPSLAHQAVSAALNSNWDDAVALNRAILQEDPHNIDALNRLARAYAEKGSIKNAITTAKTVLKVDPFNSIATKCLGRWATLSKGDTNGKGSVLGLATSANAFLEEPGKTKIVNLLYIGDEKTIAQLDAGDEVDLSSHNHRVCINSKDGKYVGRFPDDLSARLKKLISKGNEYRVFIKSVEPHTVKVFIREVKRSPELADMASFAGDKVDYISFTPPELVHKDRQVQTEIVEEV